MGENKRRVSIRTVLLVLLVAEIAAAVGLTWWLWYRNGQKAVTDVEAQLSRELAARIELRIRSLVAAPKLIAQLNEDAHRLGKIDLEALDNNTDYLVRQIRAFPRTSYIELGTATGKFIGVERVDGGALQLETLNGAILETYPLDDKGSPMVDSMRRRDNFVVANRPWYAAAVRAGKPTWTKIYPFFSEPPRLGITAVRPITDEGGNTIAVLGADLVLTHIDDYLRTLEVGKTGRAFIIEPTGELVASSSDHPSVRTAGKRLERIVALEFPDPLVSGAALALQKKHGGFAAIGATYMTASVDGGRKVLIKTAVIKDELGLDWLAVVVVPEDDFMGRIKENTRWTLLLFLVLLGGVGLTIVFTTRRLTQSIMEISAEMNRVAEFELEGEEQTGSALREIAIMQSSMGTMKNALRSFEKYVPSTVVRKLVSDSREAKLEVEPAEVTIAFADIAGFTELAEALPTEELVAIMSDYFEEMSNLILDSRGTVDKYIGDSIMAFWNAPIPVPDHPVIACVWALQSVRRLEALQESWAERGLPNLVARTGIHTGSVLVGNLGSQSRFNYTVIGDPVNAAARLEGLNKLYGTLVLISGAVHDQVKEAILCRPIDIVAPKGKSDPMRVYEPIAPHETASDEDKARANVYAAGHSLYLQRRFADAQQKFAEYLELVPGDKAAEVMITRCAELETNPPPESWRGVHVMSEK